MMELRFWDHVDLRIGVLIFISSLPHQTPQMWEESLRLPIEPRPRHVSVYDLRVEQGTEFGVFGQKVNGVQNPCGICDVALSLGRTWYREWRFNFCTWQK
ncbi:hypothetical protein D5086_028464 [Populus alba]|uniref:Uncharacterized protein n=1 Tax=Populus alba TaxID=43335 RepID=A0ACC4AYL2_POPAL